ncbi:methionine ABC transporter ATP-binding protein [Enterococcus nangangensis]|uniref:methionine ABC transporter ATP-binding protein n=1 Tax=Enterococcus nangangensis TaxID=2559926 RepID=UPI0010F48345|nr:methionine ABC transporter ATP-binding protein [Enterococcus nangangensis]
MAIIQLRNVSKTFHDGSSEVNAVADVNLTVEAGDIFGIVGYSGAGKSTLVRLLNGLEQASAGEVDVRNQDITKLSAKDLRNFRRKVGMIFQHFNLLWSRTVEENIELPLEIAGVKKVERKKRAQELIRLVGLEGRGKHYPSQLSGGQKQRVGIARALANNPEILLCDEATSALDPQTTDEVLELLLSINKQLGLTIVLITHEMHVIRKICNKVAVMGKGTIVEKGDTLEIFRNPQQDITKRFVKKETAEDDTEGILQAFQEENPNGLIVNLHFTKDSAEEPLISQAIRKFPIDISVIQGAIQKTSTGRFGNLTVLLNGPAKDQEKTLLFFQEQGVDVEVLSHE